MTAKSIAQQNFIQLNAQTDVKLYARLIPTIPLPQHEHEKEFRARDL